VRAVRFIAWSGAAGRAVSGLILAALLAVAGGAVLTAWAGARRTDSAYPRLTKATNHADVVIAAEGDPEQFDPSIAAEGPGVAASGLVDGYGMADLQPDGTVDLDAVGALVAPMDRTAFYEIDRPLMLEGRLPDPDTADEVIVNQLFRDAGHPVGSTLAVCLFNFTDALAFSEGLEFGLSDLTPEQRRAFVDEVCAVHQLRVVGVSGVGPDDVVLREDSEGAVFVIGSPALAAHPGTGRAFGFALVKLEPGADVNAFVDAVLDRSSPEAGVNATAASLRARIVSRTVEPYVRALALFAAIAAIAAIGVLGPAVVRWTAFAESDRAPLRSAGLRPQQLRLATSLRGAVLGAIAATGAVAVAIGASGWFPIGVAAKIEPEPGIRIDATVLPVGAGLVVLLCAALGAAAPTSSRLRVRRPSRIADGLQARGVRPAVVSGVRAALSREAGAGPTAGGVAIALAAVVTALTYQAGLGRLLETPARYGWTWDVSVDGNGNGLPPELLDTLEDEPLVTALSVGRRTALLRDGTSVPTFAFEPVRGSAYPTIIEGRAPRGDAEVALGAQTLDRLSASIGDQVEFRGPNSARIEVSIVGRTLLPLLFPSIDVSIAEGALVDGALLDRVGGADVDLALIDLAPGATASDLQKTLQDRGVASNTHNAGTGNQILGPEYTADLRGYDAVRDTPLLLAGLLSVLGLGVLAHTITGTARRRRRELAVLRCLGFVGRDLRASIRWNALTVVGVCLAVSVPFGVGIGRTLWSSFADGIGVVDDPLTPALQVVAVVVATVAAAIALATIPGRRAGRARPAAVLRSE